MNGEQALRSDADLAAVAFGSKVIEDNQFLGKLVVVAVIQGRQVDLQLRKWSEVRDHVKPNIAILGLLGSTADEDSPSLEESLRKCPFPVATHTSYPVASTAAEAFSNGRVVVLDGLHGWVPIAFINDSGSAKVLLDELSEII